MHAVYFDHNSSSAAFLILFRSMPVVVLLLLDFCVPFPSLSSTGMWKYVMSNFVTVTYFTVYLFYS